ncbi:hypothetical protein Back2_20200 [Nocardioides baekrokdamisoli]|uniref:Lipoprotein n=1 Tax=Nocardioides baekrokdamisoli TaxID=1804624 RepID=A0A3G9IZB6_9ACTN|nr:hypothetical protein Back2_20200 [Nocardioides baekrokdamisoli]
MIPRLTVAAALIVATLSACSAQTDGDQWFKTTVVNDSHVSVVLRAPTRAELHPGESAGLTLNQNSNPQQIEVDSVDGRNLGCLSWRTGAALRVLISRIGTCDSATRSVGR